MSKELIKVFGYKQNLCSGQNFESSSCAFIKYFFMFFIKHWQLLNKREKIKLYVKISFLMILLDISTLAYSTIKTLQNSFLFRAIDMRYNWISTTAVAEHNLLWTSSSRMKYDILIVRIAIKSTIRKGRKEKCGIFKNDSKRKAVRCFVSIFTFGQFALARDQCCKTILCRNSQLDNSKQRARQICTK